MSRTDLAGDDSLSRLGIAAIATLLGLMVILLLQERGDYRYYGIQWMNIVHGENPWFDQQGQWNTNAYGPAHAILAWPYAWWHKLPRIVFLGIWVSIGLFLLRTLRPEAEKPNWLYLLLFWAAPFLWSEIILSSDADVMTAALCLVALTCAGKRPVLSGFLLAVAVASKLYPLALLPFFAVQRGRPQWRWIASAAATLVVIYGAAFLLWGPSVWYSFTLAATRDSTPYSLFFFLKSPASPLRLFSANPNLDWLSVPLLAVGGLALWVIYVVRRWSPGPGVMAAFCLVLILYKVGHDQFQMLLYLGVIALWWGSRQRIPAGLRGAIIAYCAWINLSSFLQVVLHRFGDAFGEQRYLFCLPTAGVLIALFVCLVRWSESGRGAPATP